MKFTSLALLNFHEEVLNNSGSYINSVEMQNQIDKLTKEGLSNREISVLSFWISGYSIKETAKILHASLRTIEDYRSKIKDKLHIKDKKNLYKIIRHLDSLEFCFDFAIQQCETLKFSYPSIS